MRQEQIANFMQLCFTIANRSADPNTKCGAIITDMHGRIIGTGYNGMPIGTDPDAFPWIRGDGSQDDPDSKYPYVHHAEKNAILNCSVIPRHIGGAVCYVNGKSCYNCVNDLWQYGVHTIYQGNLQPRMVDEKHKKIIDKIVKETNIHIVDVDCSRYPWYEFIKEQYHEHF